MRNQRWTIVLLCSVCLLVPLAGCGGGDSGGGSGSGGRRFITLGTAPVGGAFAPVGNAIASVLNENKGENQWRVQAKSTKGSQQNIRMLDAGEIQLALSNSAISYYAARGEQVWSKPYEIRTVATLAPNVGIFIAKKSAGIRSLADLKGKRVTVGPGGAGFEMFLGPLLTAHGVQYTGQEDNEFTPINEVYSASVALLGDGNADACFMGGAIPTPAVTQACSTMDIFFIPYDPQVRDDLIQKYPFFQPITVPDGTYSDLEGEFVAMNVGSMHLITSADADEEQIYQLTKTIWENREAIAEQHPAGKAINEKNVARYTGTEFHPGAIRFYQELGIWSEESGGKPAAPAEDQPADDEPADDEPAEETPAEATPAEETPAGDES